MQIYLIFFAGRSLLPGHTVDNVWVDCPPTSNAELTLEFFSLQCPQRDPLLVVRAGQCNIRGGGNVISREGQCNIKGGAM